MKKLNLAIALAIGLSVPLAVVGASGNDLSQQKPMNMKELSSEAVNKADELPDAASDQAESQPEPANQYRWIKKSGQAGADDDATATKKKFKHQLNKKTDDIEGEGSGVMDRDRIQDQDKLQTIIQDQDRLMDQDQDRTMEMDQDQIRDTEHEFDNEPSMIQEAAEDPPMAPDPRRNELETGQPKT